MTDKSGQIVSLYCVVLCVIVGVSYLKALDCGFVFDDVSAITENKDLRPKTPIRNLFVNDFWGTPMWKEKSHKSYRPLCVLTFRWNYAWNELAPMSYHLVNVVLHAVVTVMYMKVMSMFLGQFTSFLAALLFAIHPIHTEAVTGVVGRAEVLSSIFFLAAILTYSKCSGYRKQTSWLPLMVTVALVTIAMLCKEQGITVIAICVVYELFVAQRAKFSELWQILLGILTGKPQLPKWLWQSIVRSVVLVGSTLFLLIARIKVMGAQLPIFTRFDNPASLENTPYRQMTYNYLLPVNMGLLLCPANLFCDWTMGTIPIIRSLLDPRNIFTVIFYLAMAKFAVYALSNQGRRNRALIMALAFMVFPFIPASNFFFPVGFVVAERILYTPSMGFCMAVALGFEILLEYKKSLKPLLWIMMSFMVLLHTVKTFTRNEEWVSEYSLFKSALKFNHLNAKLWNNVGHALETDQRYEEALEYFQTAASAQPDDIGAHQNVGRTFKNLKMYREAEEAFTLAKDLFPPMIPGKSYSTRIAPNHLNVYLNLASLVSKDPSRLSEADKLLEEVIHMRSDYVEAYINRGDIMMKMGRAQEALNMYHAALKHDPDLADIYYNLGVVHMELGQKAEGKKYFELAVEKESDHQHALYNSAMVIQEHKLVKEYPVALERFRYLMQLNKTDSKNPFSIAMLYMDMGQFLLAEENFKLALELQPDMLSALFNIALLLNNDLGRPLDAIPYLNKLLSLDADHFKAYLLLGEIGVNTQKDLNSAEYNFEKALALAPNSTEAMHNLCVVYVERGDLYRAETCLFKVHKHAPGEEYIFRHLQIVRAKIKEFMDKRKAAGGQTPPAPPASDAKSKAVNP